MQLEVPWMVFHSHPVEGHAFLRGSIQPAELSHELRQDLEDFTDRTPNYGDGRVQWPPYPGGRPIGPWYVVTWTRRDEQAQRRGSIITQALLFPRDAFVSQPDLGTAILVAQEVLPQEGHLTVTLSSVSPSLMVAGRVLLTAFVRQPGDPVALIGESGWEAGLTGLWAVLWPAARVSLTFRAFDEPHQVVGNPDLILTPRPGHAWVRPAWAGGVVNDLAIDLPPLASEEVQHGQRPLDFTATVRQARQANALAAAVRDALNSVEATVHAFTQLEHAPVQDTLRTMLTSEYVERLHVGLAGTSSQVIQRLVTVTDTRGTALQDSLTNWFRQALIQHPADLRVLMEGLSLPLWIQGAIQSALRQATPDCATAQLLWEWWMNPIALERTLPGLTPAWDECLMRTIPEGVMTRISREQVLSSGWPGLYGVLTARAGEWNDLLDLPDRLREVALHTARQTVSPETYLAWALQHSDPIVLAQATSTLIEHPNVLADADLHQRGWLAVWTDALRTLPSPDPGHRFADVLGIVAEGLPVPVDLLIALAENGRGQLLTHPQRDVLLPRLPPTYSQQTADAYLRSPTDPGPINSPLLKVIKERLSIVSPSPATSWRLMTMLRPDEIPDVVERSAAQELTAENTYYVESLPEPLIGRLLRWAPDQVRWSFRRYLDPVETVLIAHRLQRQVEAHEWWRGYEAFVLSLGVNPRGIWEQLHWPTVDFPVGVSERQSWQHAISEMKLSDTAKVREVLRSLRTRRQDRKLVVDALIDTFAPKRW